MHFVNKLIIQGQIPYFSRIKKLLLILSFTPIPLYFFTDIYFGEYGDWGWKVLIAIMLIRPLADVLPRISLLHALVPLRKEFGIFSGLLIFIHSYAFFANKDQNIFIQLFNANNWAPDKALTWGILGFITVFFLLATSNNLSIKILKRNWKNIQRLAYPLFFFSAIHIALVNRENMWKVIIPVTIIIILWLMAHFKVTLLTKEKNHE